MSRQKGMAFTELLVIWAAIMASVVVSVVMFLNQKTDCDRQYPSDKDAAYRCLHNGSER